MPPKNRIKKRCRRRLGARSYKNYSEEMLLMAVDLVRNKKTSSYDAEKQFGIPRRTIEKRVKNLHSDKPGPRFRLTDEEEAKFVNVLIAAGDFGCPLSQLDLKLTVYDYLKKNNRTYIFNDKLPGDWWVKYFLERHNDQLTLRSTQNITRARAEKTLEEFKEYFNNLETSLRNIPPNNVLNYDETNVNDDPGSTKCIFRRGVKYPERIINHSKGCISIMFAGTASGELLPPYVVYKSENLWNAWCSDGPTGARFNRSKSGWFDSTTFLDWFINIVIPWADRQEGDKLIIGDNLSSHLNPEVVELCEAHRIRFVFLPSRSTQLTQPLDVAFFGPLKKSWRKIILQYKMENPKQTSLNKSHFPLLLKRLMEAANMKKQNVLSGFKATGIHPFNPYEVYKKMPEYEDDIKYNVDQSLLDFLKENKHPNPIKKRKNYKLNVLPGKSVSSTEISCLSVNGKTNTKKKTTTKKINTSKLKKSETDIRQKEEISDPKRKEKVGIIKNTSTKKAAKKKPLKRNIRRDDSSDSDTNCSVPSCDSSEYDVKDDEDSNKEDYKSCETNMERNNEEVMYGIESEEVLGSQVMEETNKGILIGINHAEVEKRNEEFMSNIELNENLPVQDLKKVNEEMMSDLFYGELIMGGSKESNKKMRELEEIPEVQDMYEKNMEVFTSKDLEGVSVSQEIREVKKIGKGVAKRVTILSDIKNTQENQKYFNLHQFGPFQLKEINTKDSTLVLPKKEKGNSHAKAKSSCPQIKMQRSNMKENSLKVHEYARSTTNPSYNVVATDNDFTAGCSKEPEGSNLISYAINDYILARYIFKKKIEYFVGIITQKVGNKYEVSFLKRYGRSDNTTFKKPKKNDIDTIDQEMIVKEVQLIPLNEHETEFVFLDDDDLVYFDY